MAGPTIEDLRDLANSVPGDPGSRIWSGRGRVGYQAFQDTVIYMFGDDVEMAKALVGQIHALQAQIRTMRAEQEAS